MGRTHPMAAPTTIDGDKHHLVGLRIPHVHEDPDVTLRIIQ